MGKKLITHLKHIILFSTKAFTAFKLIRRVTEMVIGVEDINTFSISSVIWCFYIILKWRSLSVSSKKQEDIKHNDNSFKK